MHFWYLPEPGFSLWPCAVLIAVFVPLSIYHERNWRRTLRGYAAARREAGAVDAWPPEGAAHLIGVQPWLLFAAAGLLAAMTAFGLVVLFSWPHRLPYFDEVLNYYDRPYLAAMCVVGLAGVIGVLALAIDLARQPWAPVASRVRRAIYAPADKRAELFAAALALDAGVAPTTSTERTS